MQELGKTLIIVGILMAVIGVLFMFSNKMPLIGKLPGDILVQRKNFSFYLPFGTSVVLSIILSLIFWLWPRR